jgi:hypothetical protein
MRVTPNEIYYIFREIKWNVCYCIELLKRFLKIVPKSLSRLVVVKQYALKVFFDCLLCRPKELWAKF